MTRGDWVGLKIMPQINPLLLGVVKFLVGTGWIIHHRVLSDGLEIQQGNSLRGGD